MPVGDPGFYDTVVHLIKRAARSTNFFSKNMHGNEIIWDKSGIPLIFRSTSAY